MNSVNKSSGIFILLGLLSILAVSEAFYVPEYYLPGYYQRFMDENQAVMQNLMAMVEEAKEQNEQSQPEQKVTVNKIAEASKTPSSPASSDVMPKRDLRQYFQYKRMRPCFYSPIQCLMKRSGQV
ncbi:hypothetical protein FO519_008727 [Halicephalobus sp. NKZ332]|nr:hypothetical protein FO519_008727 [Halicephalobus sp. NKZ332]